MQWNEVLDQDDLDDVRQPGARLHLKQSAEASERGGQGGRPLWNWLQQAEDEVHRVVLGPKNLRDLSGDLRLFPPVPAFPCHLGLATHRGAFERL